MSTTPEVPSAACEGRPRYSMLARTLHWSTFVLVAITYASINIRKLFEKGTDERILASETHFLIGMVVLMITLPRLANRFYERAPAILPPQPRWMGLVSSITHGLLYAFLVVQPVLGVVARLAEGKGIGLPFTDAVIPSFFGHRQALAEQMESWHVWLGETFYWVIGLHILAALFHLLVRKDNVVQRM